MSCPGRHSAIFGRRPDVHVEWVGTVKIDVEIGAGNVGVPQSECLRLVGGLKLEGALGVLAQAIERGPCFGERGRELNVLVLKNEKGGRV